MPARCGSSHARGPTIALRFPYLIVGGQGYLKKRTLLLVALAPVVIWGLVLVSLLATLRTQFYLSAYIVTVLNFAGSSGDYFQAYAIAKLPPPVLVRDDGRVTTVYLPPE